MSRRVPAWLSRRRPALLFRLVFARLLLKGRIMLLLVPSPLLQGPSGQAVRVLGSRSLAPNNTCSVPRKTHQSQCLRTCGGSQKPVHRALHQRAVRRTPRLLTRLWSLARLKKVPDRGTCRSCLPFAKYLPHRTDAQALAEALATDRPLTRNRIMAAMT